jgi:hypothetical protein
MLAAVGVSSINSGWVRAGSVVVLLVLAGHAVLFYYSHPEKEEWRQATAYVVSHPTQKDAILFYIDTGRLGFDYYARLLGAAGQTGEVVFPASFDWGGDTAENGPDGSVLATLPEHYGRVWLFLSHDNTATRQQKALALETSLAAQYPDVKEQKFRGVRVLTFGRK